jgi:lipoprotein-releasing system permease protein
MDWPYELQIGWRYTRAGRSGRRNRFISFISAASMAGIALGVAALIIVLSVMNGFRKEVRDRMLSVVSHVEVGAAGGAALGDWQAVAERCAAIRRSRRSRPSSPPRRSSPAATRCAASSCAASCPPRRRASPSSPPTPRACWRAHAESGNVVLGVELAKALRVKEGDKVSLILPGRRTSAAGVVPRSARWSSPAPSMPGHFEYDNGLALVHLADAEKLFQLAGPERACACA